MEVGGCWGHVDSRDLTKVPADEEDGAKIKNVGFLTCSRDCDGLGLWGYSFWVNEMI